MRFISFTSHRLKLKRLFRLGERRRTLKQSDLLLRHLYNIAMRPPHLVVTEVCSSVLTLFHGSLTRNTKHGQTSMTVHDPRWSWWNRTLNESAGSWSIEQCAHPGSATGPAAMMSPRVVCAMIRPGPHAFSHSTCLRRYVEP